MKPLALILLILPAFAFSQQKQFDAGLSFGFKGSSINGRGFFKSFSQPGITGGIFVKTDIDKNYAWQFEINYAPKGSNPNYDYYETSGYIRLKYVEFPVILKIKLKEKGETIETGLAMARLIYYRQLGIIPEKELNPFHKNDFSFLFGYDHLFYMGKRNFPFYLNFRYLFSIVRITKYSYNLPESNSLFNFAKRGQYNRVFTVTLRYLFDY